jgi:hypothetical protein
MKYRKLLSSAIFFLLFILLTACFGSGVSFNETPSLPTLAESPTLPPLILPAPTESPTVAPSISPTFVPSPTLVEKKASLSGTVFMTGPDGIGGWPFPYGVELRQGDFSKIAAYPDPNRPQNFLFENIEPGIYQLWVLIPTETLSLKNCYDVGLPDKQWKLGRILDNEVIFSDPTMSYREALDEAVEVHSSDPNRYNFYAVLENVDIKSEKDIYVDANLICKRD